MSKKVSFLPTVSEARADIIEALHDYYSHKRKVLNYQSQEEDFKRLEDKYDSKALSFKLTLARYVDELKGMPEKQIAEIFTVKNENGKNLWQEFCEEERVTKALISKLDDELKKNPAYKNNEKIIEKGGEKTRVAFGYVFYGLKAIAQREMSDDGDEIKKIAKKYLSEEEMREMLVERPSKTAQDPQTFTTSQNFGRKF